MPDVREFYLSFYSSTVASSDGVALIGEMVVVRNDNGQGKGYHYALGMSQSSMVYNGDYKPKDGHYFDISAGVPLDKYFDHLPKAP